MKLIFVINNGEAVMLEYEYSGILNSPKRRAVEIELTPDQIDKINLQVVGFRSKVALKETIESVSIKELT